jgi:hypothetical protein
MKKKLLLFVLNFIFIHVVNAQNLSFQQTGIGGGGAFFCPSINPNNTSEFFVSSDMSGLYRTTNAGINWGLLNAQNFQASTNSKVGFTSNNQIFYSIDHTSLAGVDVSRPVKTVDGGITWVPIANDPTNGEAYTLITDPTSTNEFLISNYDQLWYTNDGGTNYQLILTFNNNGNGLHLAGAFFEGNSIYIGTSAGLMVSSNGGNTFIPIPLSGWPLGCGMSSFCGAIQNGQTKLLAIAMQQVDLYAGISGADFNSFVGIYSCNGLSSTWTQLGTSIPSNHKFFFVGCARNNTNDIYVGGGDTQNGVPTIYKSSTGGNLWTSVFNTTLNANIITGWSGDGGDRSWGYGDYLLGMDVGIYDATKILFTDLGFVHKSENGGTNWKQCYVSSADENAAGSNTPVLKNYHSVGLENTTCWNLAWLNNQKMYAAFSDINGIKSEDAGTSWSMANATTFNSTYYFLKHPTSNTIYTTTSTVHDIYQTTRLTDALLDPGLGGIKYSNNNGVSWQTLHDFNHPVIWIAIDPNNTNRMYASVIHYANGVGEGDIWKSDNIQNGSASVWTPLPSPPRTEGHPLSVIVLNDGSVLASYCGRRNSSGTFTASSGVFLLPAGSSIWLDRSDAGMLYYTKDVVVDPHDASQNTWYACVWSGWGGAPNGLGGLYKTSNRGVTWTRIWNGADRVSSITIHPTNANLAFISTETDGLWETSNLSSLAPTLVRENGFPFRQPERIFFNPTNANELWVTSFGGGLFKSSLTNTGLNEKTIASTFIYPNPVQDKIYFESKKQIKNVALIDLNGRRIEMNVNENYITLPILKSGVYFLEINYVDRTSSNHKIMIDQ